jgi:hypothetical protein
MTLILSAAFCRCSAIAPCGTGPNNKEHYPNPSPISYATRTALRRPRIFLMEGQIFSPFWAFAIQIAMGL